MRFKFAFTTFAWDMGMVCELFLKNEKGSN